MKTLNIISIALSTATIIALFILGGNTFTMIMISASVLFFAYLCHATNKQAKAVRVRQSN